MVDSLNQDNQLMFFALYVAAGFVGLVGNILVFRTFWRWRRASWFHLQLAVANITNLTSIAMAAPSALTGRWLLGDIMCSWFGVQAFTGGFAEITFTCLVAMECYLATQETQLYKKISPSVFRSISAGVWGFAVSFALAPLVGWNRFVRETHGTSCGLDLLTQTISGRSYFLTTQTVYLVLGLAALFCVLMTVSNTKDESSGGAFNPLLTDGELTKVSGALLLTTSISCIPYYLRVLWYLLGYQPVFAGFLGVEFSHLAIKVGSACHPVLYFTLSRNFRTTWLVLATGAARANKGH